MYEELINKLTTNITKLEIIKNILIEAPKINVDAKIVVKSITNIDLDTLESHLY